MPFIFLYAKKGWSDERYWNVGATAGGLCNENELWEDEDQPIS